LFLEEIARELRKSGELQRLLEMPAYRLKDAVSELYLPDRVQTLIMSRIDALPGVTKEVLRAAAVLGEQFDWPSVRAILEAEWAADLDTRVRELVDKAMLEPTDDASIYRFRHGLIREVAYGSLAFSRRRRLHQRAGSFFEVSHFSHLLPVYETLAYHYLRGGNKPRALLYSIRAGDKARAAFANEEGVDHYTRALALARDVSPREARDAGVDAGVSAIHISLGDLLGLSGAQSDAVHHYGSALDELVGARVAGRRQLSIRRPAPTSLSKVAAHRPPSTKRVIAGVCRRVGTVHERISDYVNAKSWFLSALSVLPPGSPAEKTRVCLGMAVSHFRGGDYASARYWCLRALRNARNGHDKVALAHAYNGLGVIDRDRGVARRAIRHRRISLSLYVDMGDLAGQAETLNNLGLDHFNLGDWTSALDCYQKGLEIADRMGDLDLQAIIRNNMGEVFLARGEPGEAKKEFRWTIEARNRLGHIAIGALAEANLGQALALENRLDEARTALERSALDFRQINARAFEIDTNVRIAALSLLEGKPEVAWRQAVQAAAAAEKLSLGPVRESAALILGKVATTRGDWRAAEAHLGKALALSRKAGNLLGEGKALSAMGTLFALKAGATRHSAGNRRARAYLGKSIAILRALGASIDLQAAEDELRRLTG
jgi:tetratricopeptide (TPR) repeat protein